MKVAIHDDNTLKLLRPLDLAAYFRTRGWRQVRHVDGKAIFWSYTLSNGRQYDVILPLRQDLADYTIRMSEILTVLEALEDRSQMEIIRDLFTASFDVVRVRARPEGSGIGMVRIDEGVELVQHAREMVMAAACSAAHSRAVFASRKPSKAIEYVKDAKFGQTEHGSYVLTIISPLELVSDRRPTSEQLIPPEPFGRRVVKTLAHAVAQVRETALKAAASGRIEVFSETVTKGVSANLCDAIVGISNVSSSSGFDLNFTWAATSVMPTDIPQSITIPSDAVSIIKDAARYFRDTSPREDFIIEGIVTGLNRKPGQSTGRVQMLAFIDERPRSISMELLEEQYNQAVQAHYQRQPVTCVGQLVKAGRSFELDGVRDFSVRNDEAEQPSLF